MSILVEFRPDGPYVKASPNATLEDVQSVLTQHGFYDFDPTELTQILEDPRTWHPLRRASRDAAFELQVTDDEMGVLLTITPPQGFGRPVTEEAIQQRLNQLGVIHGVNWLAIRNALSQQRADGLLVCAGSSPTPGQDGWYNIFAYADTSGPKIREDGTADYRDLGKFVFVKDGEVIGRVHKATPGQPGMTVLGRPIPSTPGKEVDLTSLLGEHLRVDSHGGIVALKAGHLHRDAKGKYSIQTTLHIDGDVDFSVGDIRDFPGDLVIKGSVTKGFSVSAAGSIYIDGRIEGSTVISHNGDVIVSQGIIGRQGGSFVQARGHVVAKFIESATVRAGESVISREAILHSQVRAGNAVICDEGKGWICGGDITAGSFVQAKTIGSQISTKTRVEAGYDEIFAHQLQELTKQVEESQDTLAKCQELLKELLIRYGPSDKRYKQVLLTKEHHLKNITSLTNMKQAIHRKLLEKKPCVSASAEVHQGTVIEILGLKHVVKAPRSHVTYLVQDGVLTDTVYRSRPKPTVHTRKPK